MIAYTYSNTHPPIHTHTHTHTSHPLSPPIDLPMPPPLSPPVCPPLTAHHRCSTSSYLDSRHAGLGVFDDNDLQLLHLDALKQALQSLDRNLIGDDRQKVAVKDKFTTKAEVSAPASLCVCMFVCLCMCMLTCVYVCMYVCVCVCYHDISLQSFLLTLCLSHLHSCHTVALIRCLTSTHSLSLSLSVRPLSHTLLSLSPPFVSSCPLPPSPPPAFIQRAIIRQ